MKQEMDRPMTETEEKICTGDTPREVIVLERIWNKRPDGFTIIMPTTETVGELVRYPGIQENVFSLV
jgi:hypothetical protein